DPVYFYQSQMNQAIVGLMEVIREAYPDPTSGDPQWLTCDFRPVRTLCHPVALEIIRRDSRLQNLGLVRSPRLAVMPVEPGEAQAVHGLSGGEIFTDNIADA